MKEVLGQSVLILGYGKEGQSAHRYLSRNHPSKKVGIADQRHIESVVNSPAKLYTGEEYLQSIRQYNVIIRSPGVPLQLPALQEYLKAGKKVTSATNIFFSECPGTIIGITGTKGKSTTTSLIFDILRKEYPDVRLVGNIGRPALDYPPKSNKKTIFVTELSCHQLEDAHYSPHIAVLLAIFPEHLDRYKDFSQYIGAKEKILEHQTNNDIVVFNPFHQIVNQLVSRHLAQKRRFSLRSTDQTSCFLDQQKIFTRKKNGQLQPILNKDEIPLLGEGNIENVLAAISVGALLGASLEKIRRGIIEFKSLEHRIEFVGEYHGIRFYDDSIATIPEATIHALRALGDDVETLIVGGHERNLDFSRLGKFLGKSQLKTLILFPSTGKKIWQALCMASPKEKQPQKYEISSMKRAVKIAYQRTSPGKICLLSPASASFGLFRDYQARGNLFKKFILEKKK